MVIQVDVDRTIDTDFPEKVRQGHKKYLKEGMAYGFAVSQEEAPEDRGQLRRSGFAPEWRGDTLVFGYDAPHAEPQEEGTDPYLAPFEPLVEWAERVGGGYGLAIHTWRKIAREGIEPKGYMSDGAEAAEDWYSRNDPSDYIEDEF